MHVYCFPGLDFKGKKVSIHRELSVRGAEQGSPGAKGGIQHRLVRLGKKDVQRIQNTKGLLFDPSCIDTESKEIVADKK